MLYQDPIRIVGPLGRIYSFSRRYHGDDFFEGPRLAFHHDRAYARDHLLRLTRSVTGDPFNYRLLDVWQLVFQKPWTRPRNLNELVSDLTDKIHRGELFVYLEPNLERNIPSLLKDGPPEGEADFVDIAVLNGPSLPMDRPRVSGPGPVNRPGTWGEDYASGLKDTVSAVSSDIAAEQTELYDNTSGWGNVMYPVFKPVENFGSFIGNTVGLMSAFSPRGMNPKVTEYWQGIGESFRALGDKVVDAVGGDGRAAGEITPAVASILVTKKVPKLRFKSLDELNALKGTGSSVGDFSNVRGMSVSEIVANIPADASARKLRPVEDKSQLGLEYKWTDSDGIANRLRIHDPDPSYPGSNASNGWVARWQRKGGYYNPETGEFAHRNAHNPNSPHYHSDAANDTHIPIAEPDATLADLMRFEDE